MKNELEKFMKDLGIPQDVINVYKADEIPEDFNSENAVTEYHQKRRDLVLNDSKVQEEMKKKYNAEAYHAIMKPIVNKITSAFGISKDEAAKLVEEGKSYPPLKNLLTLGIDNLKSTSAQTADEANAKYFEIKKQLEEQQTQFEQELKAKDEKHAHEWNQAKVQSAFGKVVRGMKDDLAIAPEYIEKVLSTELNTQFNFSVIDGKLDAKTLDGNKPSNGNDFLTAEQIIRNKLSQMNLLKKSNGNPPVEEVGNNQQIITQNNQNKPLSGRALEMQKRAEEKNKGK